MSRSSVPTAGIRLAAAADAAALAEFAERSFRTTFEADNSAADIAQYVRTTFGAGIQRAEIADDRTTVLLVEIGNAIAGYAQLLQHAAPSEVAAESAIEVQRFYVGHELHGTGLAQRLMNAVVDFAATLGADTLWLGVWERNERAIRFYRSQGFVDVGSHPFVLGGDTQTDRIMRRVVDR